LRNSTIGYFLSSVRISLGNKTNTGIRIMQGFVLFFSGFYSVCLLVINWLTDRYLVTNSINLPCKSSEFFKIFFESLSYLLHKMAGEILKNCLVNNGEKINTGVNSPK